MFIKLNNTNYNRKLVKCLFARGGKWYAELVNGEQFTISQSDFQTATDGMNAINGVYYFADVIAKVEVEEREEPSPEPPSGDLTPFAVGDIFTEIKFNPNASQVAKIVADSIVSGQDTPVLTVKISIMGDDAMPILVTYKVEESGDNKLAVSEIALLTNNAYEEVVDFSSMDNLFSWDYSTLTLSITNGTFEFVSADSNFNGIVFGKAQQINMDEFSDGDTISAIVINPNSRPAGYEDTTLYPTPLDAMIAWAQANPPAIEGESENLVGYPSSEIIGGYEKIIDYASADGLYIISTLAANDGDAVAWYSKEIQTETGTIPAGWLKAVRVEGETYNFEQLTGIETFNLSSPISDIKVYDKFADLNNTVLGAVIVKNKLLKAETTADYTAHFKNGNTFPIDGTTFAQVTADFCQIGGAYYNPSIINRLYATKQPKYFVEFVNGQTLEITAEEYYNILGISGAKIEGEWNPLLVGAIQKE